MRISVFGLGYVGAVSMACLARDGHQVIGVDVDPIKLELIRSGHSPIIEEGVQELTRSVVAAGKVAVTDDVTAAINDTDLSFVCVGTPSSHNGSQDLSAVKRVMTSIGAAVGRKSGFHVIVLRSTVPPGTVDEILRPILNDVSGGKVADRDFALCFQPEFLREGTSIKDYDNPPFTVIGTCSPQAESALSDLFGHLPCEFIATSPGVAELLKYACNAFHALKVTFANEIGRLSQAVNIDARLVMDLVCRDRRLNISPAYLKPAFAFGGSCLPKDLRALTYVAKQRDVTIPMLNAVMGSNRAHIEHVVHQIMGSGGRRVALIGLSFKSGTDDLRESPLVAVAETLIGKGYELRIYDAAVNLSRLIGANKRFIEESIPHIGRLMVSSVQDALEFAETVVIGSADKSVVGELTRGITAQHRVIDVVGLSGGALQCASYTGACW
jgi:GDP-mannose 6-dehydrogenase